MEKEQFLNDIRKELKGLPKDDLEDRISFYNEAIEDRLSEGKTIDEALSDIGPIDKIVSESLNDVPLVKLVKEKVKPKRSLKVWEIILLILGSPIWLPLVVFFIIIALFAYSLIWILLLLVYVTEAAIILGSFGSIILFFVSLTKGSFSLMYLGGHIMLVGAAILLFFGCIKLTKYIILLSKKIIISIKKSFITKGGN